MGIKITRIDPVSKKKHTYNNYEEAALAVGRSEKSIYVAISKKRLCAGYYWEKKETDKVFEDWMIRYIKENYKGEKSLSSIAVAIGRATEQVKRKVEYLGLKECKPKEDPMLIDAYNFRNKVQEIRKKAHKGGTVEVEIYIEDAEQNANKVLKRMEVEVDGVYNHFLNVMVNGIRRSYLYEDVIRVIS